MQGHRPDVKHKPDGDRHARVAHTPPVLCAFPTGTGTLAVVNCGSYRTDGKRMSCALGHEAGIAQCSRCRWRTPLVEIGLPVPKSDRMRGLGDLVHRVIAFLFLGRIDIAERLAGRVEALWRPRRHTDPVSLPTTPRRPCGCKARREALNRALPFN